MYRFDAHGCDAYRSHKTIVLYSILSDLGTSHLVTFTYLISLRAFSLVDPGPELKGHVKREMSESRATITREDIFGDESTITHFTTVAHQTHQQRAVGI